MSSATQVKDYLLSLQQNIVATLENLDGHSFRLDQWQREEGGGGISRLVEEGGVIERGGVNFFRTCWAKPCHPAQQRIDLSWPVAHGKPWACPSSSIHAIPMYTVHMNVRLFRAYAEGHDDVFWFGGGMDLTPYYGFEEDAVHFHQTCHDAVQPFGDKYYPEFKAWCDRYFFLKHRNEPRGIGGLFFDDLSELGFDGGFAFIKAVGDAFLQAYVPILERRREYQYGERERDWQAYRRGRYVEFNLVWDRGTLFGLQSGGRTESILMSMPPIVKWRYDWHAPAGSPEARLHTDFLIGKDWLGKAPA